ncbi:Arc family DNA-binding protein [Delftia tsuruhatensis]|uniref:Arc family DNA-binding protein n=1 Tax=Delftia tsuruhatensis TaxID=180282 RepID=UPI0023DB9477|nr:Arc family DNA-binding protein [Delftia tsuruhatensis]WEM01155.1 Arc family DNA-binding protein [Delftia tsuruhatensis]
MNDIFRSQFRLPADLAERLRVAADEAGRSLNAEIVVRLEGSFRPRGTAESAGDAIQQYLAAAQHESVVLALQADMVRLKHETLLARVSAIAAQGDLLAKTAQTDDDFAKADAKLRELEGVEEESEALRVELEQLLKRRMDVLQSIQAMQTTVAQKASDLDEGLAQYKASSASPSR